MYKFIITIFTLFTLSSSLVFADIELDQARSKQWVKELPTGYIEASASAPKEKTAEIVALVKLINEKRTQAYKEAAAADPEKKATVESVAAKAAKKIQEKLGK